MSSNARGAALFAAGLIVFMLGAEARAQQPAEMSFGQEFEGPPVNDLDGVQMSSRAWTRGVTPKGDRSSMLNFRATAYTLDGKTAAGTVAREGIVAADPDVLPLGTRIRITGAGKHSGEYVVEDTGPKIHGRKLDIKMESEAEAKQFGERTVQVEILRYGNGVK